MGYAEKRNAPTFQRAIRTERIALYRAQGMSYEEIAERLELDGIYNLNTGKPYSVGSISGDCKKIEQEFYKRAMLKIDEHKTRQMWELEQIRRKVWRFLLDSESELNEIEIIHKIDRIKVKDSNIRHLKIIIDVIRLESEIIGTMSTKNVQISDALAKLIEKYEREL